MLEPSICGATIKYQEFQAPQKIFEILATQKNPRGEYSNVFFIRRLGLSIYYSPPKTYQEFQAPQENIWNFSNPKRYPPFCTLTLWKKKLKCIEMTPKYGPILWWPQKNIHEIFMPPKYLFFWKSIKILKFKILNPKNDPSRRMCENIWVPPPPPPPTHTHTNT